MEYFFDQHFHVMHISHPNLISFFSSLENGIPELLTSGALVPNYLLGGKNRKPSVLLNRLTNTLTTFEQPIGQTLVMMDDDLRGAFASHEDGAARPELPYIHDGKMHMRDRAYDKLGMCLQLMDFSSSPVRKDTLYYPTPNEEAILTYVQDTLEGFEYYRRERPDGLFEFFPFLGINPPVHSIGFIKMLLDTYIACDRRREGKKQFFGVKFYPPLGYNPWPSEEEELEKVCLIYEFCSRYDIPIMTHCDDQGFRCIPAKEAWKNTAPSSFRPALEQYPKLRIDFAHYGWQYTPLQKNPLTVITGLTNKVPDSTWFYEITELMQDFPNIYADVSFSGTNPDFYVLFSNYLNSLDEEKRKLVASRSLFGSDFNVHLIKVESYTTFYRLFEQSPLSDEQIHAMVSENVLRYMKLDPQ